MNAKTRNAYLVLNEAIHAKKLPPKKQVNQFIIANCEKAIFIRKLQDIAVYLGVVK